MSRPDGFAAADSQPRIDAALAERCLRTVEALGLARREQVRELEPLTGGVASDIVAVDLGGRSVCLKFALARLRVEEEWRAPTHRSRAEHAWLAFAARVVPDAVPRLHGYCEETQGFAMERVAGEGVAQWKAALLAGAPAGAAAERVGDAIGRVHAASTAPGFDRSRFENQSDFHALRIEPYLEFTAARHADLAAAMMAEAARLHGADTALVHGDLSPKNVLLRDGRPVLLDAECATMGDPAFDLAFCVNHLCLKALHRPASRDDLTAAAAGLLAAHAAHVAWEAPMALEARVARLLPMLMLARVDGKSPVEYLDAQAQERVRGLARRLIAARPGRLEDVLEALGGS